MDAEFRRRLHALRAEIDELHGLVEVESLAAGAEEQLKGWGSELYSLGFHLHRARSSITSADKVAARAEDPRSPSGIPPLKRFVRRYRKKEAL